MLACMAAGVEPVRAPGAESGRCSILEFQSVANRCVPSQSSGLRKLLRLLGAAWRGRSAARPTRSRLSRRERRGRGRGRAPP
ncbi:hypothetical protein C2845_PM17G08280 [Panicum miliaceum]|uniref:Uncharacterized protein n=1 Tax=Panicum miliaceum TaxID=4540 RepID=A0A3L6Q100_PANMI|nr:hypothetical protein C2845_PM17G08280 [Panicum miliaceum]